MPQNETRADAEGCGILGDMQIAAADAAGRDAQHHLVLAGRGFGRIVDAQRPAHRIEECRLHALSSGLTIRKRRIGNHGASQYFKTMPQMPVRA